MLIKWKSEFAIDNGIIDDDHKEIIGMLNSIIAAAVSGTPAGELVGMIDALYALAEQHFKREERMQELLSFPDLASHREEHRQLLQHLVQVCADLRAGPATEVPASPSDLKSVLYKWILGHIMHSDLKIQPYLPAAAA